MQLGIVVVSWNVCDLLATCLESVFAELARSRLPGRVVVVDNASADGSPAMVRERFSAAELIVNGDNPGFGTANNQGIRRLQSSETTPSLYLFLNPDTRVLPNAFGAFHEFFEKTPRAGAAGAKLLNPNGSLQHSAFRFPGILQAWLDLFPPSGPFVRLLESPLNGRYPKEHYDSGQPFRVDFPLGAAFAVRREVVQQTGGFDERYRMYCEEIDWHWRIARAGWERWCVPAAEVIHYGGQSTGQVRLESFRALWESRRRLYGQYRSRLTVRIISVFVRRSMSRRRQRATPEARGAFEEVARIWK